MEAVDVRGRFVWHQLLTRDVPAARQFYSKLMGWKAEAWPPDPAYTVCLVGDVPTASMMPMAPEFPAEVPPHWMPYIGTRDVDGTAEAAVLAGGYIVKQPSDLKGAGRYAVLADPQGAVFAVIDPEKARPEPAGMFPPLGHFSWHELATTDHEAAFAFYSNLFGWDAMERMDMGPLGIYLVFGQNGQQKGGIYIKPPDMPGLPYWLPYAHVPSVDKAAPAVEAGGGQIMLAPMEVPGGSRVTVITDPAGAAFALHSQPDAGAAQKPKAEARAASSKPKPKAKAASAAQAKPKAKVKAKVKAKSKAKSKSKMKTKVKARAKTRPMAKAKPARKKVARAKSKKAVRRKK
jgi:predicted enzyme related to lactoylglutathione lyase